MNSKEKPGTDKKPDESIWQRIREALDAIVWREEHKPDEPAKGKP